MILFASFNLNLKVFVELGKGNYKVIANHILLCIYAILYSYLQIFPNHIWKYFQMIFSPPYMQLPLSTLIWTSESDFCVMRKFDSDELRNQEIHIGGKNILCSCSIDVRILFSPYCESCFADSIPIFKFPLSVLRSSQLWHPTF